MPSMHAHTEKKERKLRGDLSVVTLQIVLKKKKEEKKKKETKTCGVFLDSACGCCKNMVQSPAAYILVTRWITIYGSSVILKTLQLSRV